MGIVQQLHIAVIFTAILLVILEVSSPPPPVSALHNCAFLSACYPREGMQER